MPSRRPQLAKLTRPRLHNATQRERLFGLLDGARETRRAICVVGPPGAGKTTMVASWLDARSIKGIWYQVDAGDADLATFFHYLGTGVRTSARTGQRRLLALTPEYLADIPGFARRFFRQLFSEMPRGATLVLDNYQEIDAEHEFHQIVANAVDEVPIGMTLIAVSRRDPPECYARLIAHQNVAFIDWDDLKLTLDEAEVIAGMCSVTDHALVRALHEDCAGWAAGFTLFLERFRRDKEVPHIAKPSSLGAVFDYFAGELFERFPADARGLLLALSFLPRMSESAAQAVTGSPGAVKLLEDLHRRRLFTDRRRAAQTIYQFHALFLAFLRSRADDSLDADETAAITRRAADALVRDGDVEDALPLYLHAQDYFAATDLVLTHAPDLVGQGRWEVVVQWIDALPLDHVQSDCWLLYWLGAARISVEPPKARDHLERSYEQALGKRDVLCEIQAAAGIVQTYMFEHARFRPLDRWIDAIQAALQRGVEFPNADAEARIQSALLVALAYRRPDDPNIDNCAARVFEVLPLVRDVNLRVTAAAYLTLWGTNTGPIEIAARGVPLLRAAVQMPGVTPLNAAWSWFIMSWHHCLMSNRTGSDEAIRAVEEIAEKEGLPTVRKFSATIASWVEMHVCNIDEAQVWHNRLAQAIDPASLWDRASVEAGEAWLAVLRNEPRAALRRGAAAVEFFDASGCIMLRTNHRLSCIWGNVLLGDFAEAGRWIAEARRFAKRIRSHWQEIALRATEAYIAIEQGDGNLARERLRAAFGFSRESGYDHSLGQHLRPWMSRLSAAALETGIEVDYVRSQIRKFGWAVPSSRPEKWPWAVAIYTLGGVRILLNGKPLTFAHKAPKRPLAVLKALVAMGGMRVPEHKLADALWPDEEGDHALASLEIALRRLRELLAVANAIEVSEGTVSLNPPLVWCDAEAFEEWLRSDQRADQLQQAVELYRGEFLAEDANVPWAVSTRERLRAKFVHAVEELGRRIEARQNWSQAITLYLRGLDADPLAEVFYQGLMRCHLATRSKVDGLNVFRRMRQTLSVTLGVTPSLETERLHRALLDT